MSRSFRNGLSKPECGKFAQLSTVTAEEIIADRPHQKFTTFTFIFYSSAYEHA